MIVSVYQMLLVFDLNSFPPHGCYYYVYSHFCYVYITVIDIFICFLVISVVIKIIKLIWGVIELILMVKLQIWSSRVACAIYLKLLR